MTKTIEFSIRSIDFDENYVPADNTRLTTNFANLARGETRQQNLRNALSMINNRFNSLIHWDNESGDRYSVRLKIISVDLNIADQSTKTAFPLIEMLQTEIHDTLTGAHIPGVTGNSLSSYVRDYDFSVVLAAHKASGAGTSVPVDFGDLHGDLFKSLLNSDVYKTHFRKPPVICISASSSKIYEQTGNAHPVLGVEYRQNDFSLTDSYFLKTGLKPRFFMPPNSSAPFAFYFTGDLANDYSNLELASTIATMETFQRIYRPEIYNANSVAGRRYQPSLNHQDYSLTQVVYDREERSRLGIDQGKFAKEQLIEPHQHALSHWARENAHR
ncbi:DUF1852 family protein [Devosia sp. MC532]|uniref:putative oxygenase MesX n=1 Tax=Devosia sp. MC532 TaxID=2799788 RepID=UPI0018F402A3|nr:putative oxygenase MesX [Devosia sp. MC532]MBJ7576848.1 DUF1852 family protein [Devosia sp. MC532]